MLAGSACLLGSHLGFVSISARRSLLTTVHPPFTAELRSIATALALLIHLCPLAANIAIVDKCSDMLLLNTWSFLYT